MTRFGSRIGIAVMIAAGGVCLVPARAQEAVPSTASLYATPLRNLEDQPQTLESYRGKVSVIYFWATWCAPCKIETPKLIQLHGRFKARGVVVIGIALDSGDKVRAFAKKAGIDYPVLYGGPEAVAIGRDLGNAVGAVPFTVILDAEGRIVRTLSGDTPDGTLDTILTPLAG